ncbi:MAG TPA: hypothetical protein VFG63_09435 [Nocardioidaceae bacterium]|nr:hypothetical protein [Nocardioidaceae bacterium]
MIASARTSEAARLEAATRLAAGAKLNGADTKRVVALARRHPVLARYLHHSAGHLELRATLAPVVAAFDAPAPSTIEPGTVTAAELSAWLAVPGRTAAEVVAYLGAEPREKLVRAAVLDYADPTGQVPAAAFAATGSRTIAAAVVASPDTDAPTRKDAALRIVAAGARIGYAPARHIVALMDADADFASEVAASTTDVVLQRAAAGHHNLTPEAVTAIVATYVRLSEEAAETGQVTTVYPADWMWAATHPAATREQRILARDHLAAQLKELRGAGPAETSAPLTWADAVSARPRWGRPPQPPTWTVRRHAGSTCRHVNRGSAPWSARSSTSICAVSATTWPPPC